MRAQGEIERELLELLSEKEKEFEGFLELSSQNSVSGADGEGILRCE